MLPLYVSLHVLVLAAGQRIATRLRDDRGQTTAEYALVLLGAAAVAVLLAVWAKEGGKVGKLLDTIFGSLVKMVRS
jgi:Flp pilus assembly pilin Flp